MGQLEIHDSFAPYFDPRDEIEAGAAEAWQPSRDRRAKAAAAAISSARKAASPAISKSALPSPRME